MRAHVGAQHCCAPCPQDRNTKNVRFFLSRPFPRTLLDLLSPRSPNMCRPCHRREASPNLRRQKVEKKRHCPQRRGNRKEHQQIVLRSQQRPQSPQPARCNRTCRRHVCAHVHKTPFRRKSCPRRRFLRPRFHEPSRRFAQRLVGARHCRARLRLYSRIAPKPLT